MSGPRRLYLDNAATSFPKPPGVAAAIHDFMTRLGATSGRGHYAEAVEGGRLIRLARERLNEFFNGEGPERFVFTLNTTDALNLAIRGTVAARRRLRPGEPVHVVTTAMDHNSVLRPLNALAAETTAHEGAVAWSCVPADAETGAVDAAAVSAAIRPETALVAVVHASNVAGAIQPVAEIGRRCRSLGVPMLVDAAQSAGHIPVDVRELHADLLAFPGHKGLLGPLGTGGLYLRPGMERLVEPVRHGGTGSRSELDTQPEDLPDRYESGSLNAVGIVGLSAALEWLLERRKEVFAHERALVARMLDRLVDLERFGLRLLGPRDSAARVGVFSVVHDSIPPRRLADELEHRFGVLARSGLHCAPRAHAAIGTGGEHGGATRLSVGPFVTLDDVEYACDSLLRAAGEPAATRYVRHAMP